MEETRAEREERILKKEVKIYSQITLQARKNYEAQAAISRKAKEALKKLKSNPEQYFKEIDNP